MQMRRLGDIAVCCIAYNLGGHIGNRGLGWGESSKITMIMLI